MAKSYTDCYLPETEIKLRSFFTSEAQKKKMNLPRDIEHHAYGFRNAMLYHCAKVSGKLSGTSRSNCMCNTDRQ